MKFPVVLNTAGKRPRSPLQAEQSRTNGAKSNGPVTAAGKCEVSQNRISHGFRASSVALSNEDPEAYTAHLNAYIQRYQPVDKAEEDLVGLLASSMWQVMRNTAIEVALFEIELAGVDSQLNGKFQTIDQYGRIALAFKQAHGDHAFELLRRYKTTSERAYHRALQAIENIRKDRNPNPSDPEKEKIAVQTREPDSQPQTTTTPLPQSHETPQLAFRSGPIMGPERK